MTHAAVTVYGTTTGNVRAAALSLLPFTPLAVYTMAEQAGYGLKISAGTNKAVEARRRNATAALLTCALVIIGRPKYATAIVRSFRSRGRRVYWYNPKNPCLLHDSEQGREYAALDRQKLPKTSTWEPDMWEAQRAEKMKAIDEYLYHHPESLRTPDSIPTFGWQEVFNAREFDIPETDALHWKHHGGSLAEK